MTHVLRIVAATAFILYFTLLPFLPGRYDSMAVPLSTMSQLLGRVGLLLVPVGAVWMVAARRSRSARTHYAFAIVALIASSVAMVIMCLVAFAVGALSLGVGATALWVFVVVKISRRLRAWTSANQERVGAVALYSTVVPLAVLLFQLALVPRAIELSRNRAIRNSAQLIADIEQYRAANGRYPLSILALWDYYPRVIGIEKYHYEPSGEAYNLLFEQLALPMGTREIVVYNPRDEQVATSHATDLLQYPPEQLARSRGYYAVHDAPYPHWKYFWFD